MENEKEFMKEYINRYKIILYWPLKIIGFARFDVKNKEIVELTFKTLVYRTIFLIIADLGVVYLIYTSIISRSYLKIPDGLCIIHFSTFANMLLINLTFVNRQSGLLLIRQSFKIDSHLGLEETKFMREIGVKTFICLTSIVAFVNITGGVFLYKVYDVSMSIHIIGSLYFFWLFFCYDDYCFFLVYATFLALRARYLNVALAKLGGVNVKYLSKRSILNVMLWKEQYDGLVTFQNRAGTFDFKNAFKFVFEMLRLEEEFYRFPLALGFWTIAVGTFVTSQTFIERIKNPNALEQERTYIIIGWSVLSWGFMIIVSMFMDLFQQQMEQTRLICACIQLTPNKPFEIYKLSKSLLRLLERREPRLSCYNIFFFDTGFILRMAAATLVYITVQLQLAFPKLPTNKIVIDNVTLVTTDLCPSEVGCK